MKYDNQCILSSSFQLTDHEKIILNIQVDKIIK